MSKPNDGGSTFPHPEVIQPAYWHQGTNPATTGMSLRTWLAGQALAGFMADPNQFGNPKQAAITCLDYADALIAELNKEESK